MNTLVALALASLLPLIVSAQEDPAHQKLRDLRDALVAGMNKGDVEAQLSCLHPNVVVTWHDAEVSRGREGVRAYLERALRGPARTVEKYAVEVKTDELSILYGGDTAIAFGSAREHFTLTTGRAFDLPARWTATLVEEKGQWLVASLHVSDNLYDNPLLNQMRSALPSVGGASLLGGLFVGWLLGRRGRSG